MKNILIFLLFAGIPTLTFGQFFSTDPIGDGFTMNLYGRQYKGPVVGGYDGNVTLNLRRSDNNDDALIQFNAKGLESPIIIGAPTSLWGIGLRGRDELGIYYTDGTPGNINTESAVKFNNSSSTPYASFGAPNYLARVTILNDLYGQMGMHSTASGTGIYGESTANTTTVASGPGVHGKSKSKAGVFGESEKHHGVSGLVTGSDDQVLAGVFGKANQANHYGVHGQNTAGIGVYGEGSAGNYGVYGTAGFVGVFGNTISDSQFSRGVLGYATKGIGLRGVSSDYYGVMGETGNPNSYAGYFAGNVYTTGLYLASDQQLKLTSKPIDTGLNIIKQLDPRSYHYDQHKFPHMHLPEGKRYGLIAQDVEKVLPHLVKLTAHYINDERDTDSGQSQRLDFKAVNYLELIPILIAAVQEQVDLIEALQNDQKLVRDQNELLLRRLSLLEQSK